MAVQDHEYFYFLSMTNMLPKIQ